MNPSFRASTMLPSHQYRIYSKSIDRVADRELEQLFERVYVDGGFADPDVVKEMYECRSIRSRGNLIVAVNSVTRMLMGSVIVVPPDSPARKFAAASESELHLLAVLPEYRGHGVGGDLVDAAMQAAKDALLSRMILWTRPTMTNAHRLYIAAGFRREPTRDFRQRGREFWFFSVEL
ncbi:GNAT family N-acetyltransferase [Planctomycetota bacterium]